MNIDNDLLNEILQRLTTIEVKLEEIIETKSDVNDLKKEVVELKIKDEQKRKELDEIRENTKWTTRAVVGAIISSVVALGFAIVKMILGV
jgi:hypothetical protein